MDIIRGLIGVVGLLGICYLLSIDRKKIDWRLVGIGIGLQVVMAIGMLKFPFIRGLFQYVVDFFVLVINASDESARFLFGDLANPAGINFMTDVDPATSKPIFGRMGENIAFYDGATEPEYQTEGDYEDFDKVYQELADFNEDRKEHRYQPSIFYTDEPCGMAIRRQDDLIIDDDAELDDDVAADMADVERIIER